MKKPALNSRISTIAHIVDEAIRLKIVHLYTEDNEVNGREITLNGQTIVNFGSGSYLGLEMHPSLKEGAIQAIQRYGTQFPSSRSYVSCGIYKEAETYLGQIFGTKNLIITPSTSIAHLSALPVVVEPGDALIYDQQAHYSMQFVFDSLRMKNITIEVARHNRMDILEEMINQLKEKHTRIWYAIDSVYSMFGDYAPLSEIEQLLDKYPQLHLYVDDAHGMSWMGERGSGYALSKMKHHQRMILITSLNKAFAAGGGVLVFPNEEMYKKVQLFGGHLMFSGPLRPGSLGAIVASAKIHLSDEINKLQREFQEKLTYCNTLLQKTQLQVVSNPSSPIFFIGLGLIKSGFKMTKRLMDDGYYTNIGAFPAVPESCTGIRFAINNNLTFEDIKGFVDRMDYHFPLVLKEDNRTIADVRRAFRRIKNLNAPNTATENAPLNVEHYSSIEALDLEEWQAIHQDSMLGDFEKLRAMEVVFSVDKRKKKDWKFNYVNIKDQHGQIIVSALYITFWKNHELFTSKDFWNLMDNNGENASISAMNKSLLSSILNKGLYINRSHELWKKALVKLVEKATAENVENRRHSLSFNANLEDIELFDFFKEQGLSTILEGEKVNLLF